MPDTWIWSEAPATWAATALSLVAIWLALKSWRASVAAIRSSYRPVLRPIAVRHGSNRAWFLIVKNYGRGPAFAVVIIDTATEKLLAAVDVIEPLGPRENGDETKRVGRRSINLERYMEHGVAYRLLYQDLGARWHETTFRYSQPSRPTDAARDTDVPPKTEQIRYLGPRRSGWWRREVPSGVAEYLAQNVSDED